MRTTIEEQVNDWVEAIARLYASEVADVDARTANEAAANLWSGFGYQDAPPEVLRMFSEAIAVGYAAALRDVRDGRLDEEIRGWRPELAER